MLVNIDEKDYQEIRISGKEVERQRRESHHGPA